MNTKNLDYYISLDYKIIVQKIDEVTEDNKPIYIAYCEEFGDNMCRGLGTTKDEAIESFNIERKAYISYLYSNNIDIIEPNK